MSARGASEGRGVAGARTTRAALEAELRDLRARLADAEATLHAIGNDDVDALVVTSREGGAPQIVMLEGATAPYRDFVESMREGALTVTEDGIILHANRCFTEMIGRAEVVGAGLGDFLEEGSDLRTLLQNAGGEVSTAEVFLRNAHGEPTPVELSVHLLPLQGARRIGVTVSQRASMSAVQRVTGSGTTGGQAPSSLALHTVVEHLPVGVVLVDARSGSITYANRHAEQILGRPLVGPDRPVAYTELTAWRPDGTIVEPEQHVVTRVLRGEGALREDIARVRGDGTIVQTRVSAVPVLDDAGELASVVLAFDDTTDEWLARTERDANERFRELFLGILGHDLRDPLSALVTGSTLLRQVGELSPTQSRIVDRLHASAHRMARMVNQILDFTSSRLGGGIPLKRRTMSLHDLVRALVAERQLEGGGSRIEVELAGDGTGEWDPDRLGQVLSNLLGNALTHGRPDGVVRVSARGAPGSVTLVVHNEGTPIPRELIPLIFDPFRRADVGKGGHGLGLGLYIAQQIVHGHGGTLTVDSTEADGTTFTAVLPRAPE